MKKVHIPAGSLFNELDQTFIETKPIDLELEHSLASISKWECKWHLAFFEDKKKTNEQILDYIRCMTLNPDVDPNVYLVIPQEAIKEIGEYIEDAMTSINWPNQQQNGNTRTYGKPSQEKITSELIYYWMFTQNIPLECENWHVNKLLSVIRMCSLKNTPPKKGNRNAILARNASLNAARRKALGTTG